MSDAAMSGMPPPTLNVSTGAGPSTPVLAGSLRNRPQGARRRGNVVPGLYIANPDNSDSEESAASPVRQSPVRSSPVRSSPNRTSPIASTSTSSLGATGRTTGSMPGGTPVASAHPLGSPALKAVGPNIGTPPLPSASPSAQRPSLPNPPTPHSNSYPPMSPYISPPLMGADQRPTPPQPPPQPERHMRRAFTAPNAEQQRQQQLDPRNVSQRDTPSSPSRALPPLPPMRATTIPSPTTQPSYNISPPLHPPPTPTSMVNHRMSSPDDSLATGGRQRSDSSTQRSVMVTTDNEHFSVVDLTGVQSAEGIRERIFTGLRFRDNDHPSLSIFRTDIGQQPDDTALAPQHLLQVCQNYADSRASLKFLVLQTGVPGSSAASVVPPPGPFRNRPGVPPIMTDVGPAPPYTPRHDPNSGGLHSNNSSMSSHGLPLDRSSGSRTSLSDERDPITDPGFPGLQPPSHPASMSSPSLLLSEHDDEATYRASSSAGPSNHSLGLAVNRNIDLSDADPESAALILQLQREDEAERLRELARVQEDERLALIEQESEREVWQRRQQNQVIADEEQARALETAYDNQPVASTSRVPQAQPSSHARVAWETELRDRPRQFSRDRRLWRDYYQNMNPEGSSQPPPHEWSHDPRVLPVGPRRPSEPERTSQYTQYPTYSSPPQHYPVEQPRVVNRPPPAYSPVSATFTGPFDARDPRGLHPSIAQRRPSRPPPPVISTSFDDSHRATPASRGLDPRYNAQSPYPLVQRKTHPQVAQDPYLAPTPGPENRYRNSHAYDGIVAFPSPQPSLHTPASPPRPQTPHPPPEPRRPSTHHEVLRYDAYHLPVTRQRSGSDSHLAYHDPQRLLPPHDRSSFDNISNPETSISDSTTIHPNSQEEATVRAAAAEEWQNRLVKEIDRQQAMSNAQWMLDTDAQDEATLFLEPVPRNNSNGRRLPGVPQTRPTSNATVSDSESTDDGTPGIQRNRSFAAKKRNDWHVRPEPEQLYDNLEQFFPEIDIDAPLVDPAVLSTPSTPSSESSSPRTTLELHRLPPQLPPRQASVPPRIEEPPPAKQNPVRAAMAAGVNAVGAAFNRAEYRKSIRSVADLKRRSLQSKKNQVQADKEELEDKKLKRSSSMWGHKVREVTPSELDDIPPIPESPASDGKPMTLEWIKGELIGRGSYGRVYLGLNVTTGDMMAVKQVELLSSAGGEHDPRQSSMVEALLSEISLLKDLYHPNIVAYLGYETSKENLSIFLEYVPGGTIAAIYRAPNQGRFEEQLVKFFTRQIVEGLAYLHDQKIWHRDLKGDNILVDANGVCKISDFGISKKTEEAYDSINGATNMKGSTFWMAPEAIQSNRYSAKVDIWSLGCVVIEMWTGARPWGTLNQYAVMFKLCAREYPPLPADIELDPIANDFLYAHCLATEPSDRPTAVELLKHPFLTERDPAWTFRDSKIGMAVTKRSARAKAKKPRSLSSSAAA